MSTISKIKAREVLDSRGNPTVDVEVTLADGSTGTALVPSGASTGTHEALEMRDGDRKRYNGKGVLNAVANVDSKIAPRLLGQHVSDQKVIDDILLELDGTEHKSELGANAILGVSMAVARAAAQSEKLPLYTYFSKGEEVSLPVPMFNIINGGRHADNSTDFQEFMVIPAGFDSFKESLRAGVEIYHALEEGLRDRALGTAVGDEGGFAPPLQTNRQAIDLVIEAIERAGYKPGEECFLAMDVAATELRLSHAANRYSLRREEINYSAERLIEIYESWIQDYPIISIEDGIAEDDWAGWSLMVDKFGDKVQIVGDDLYTTNTTRIKEGIGLKASNAVLMKLNQIGTVTETLDAIKMTEDAGWGTVISHRSGETEDTTIADLAVGTNSGQIKAGAPARGERTSKYNRLLRIEEELGSKAKFGGLGVYDKFLRNR